MKRGTLRPSPRVAPAMDPLVQRAKDGDTEAFGELFTKNSPWVYARLRRMLGPGPEIEDLVQEVFIRAYRSLPTFRGQSRFEAWLRRICARVAYDEIRSGRRRPQLELVEGHELGQISPDMERREAAKHLMRLIGMLPAANRIVLLLHDVEGYTAEEIRMVVGARSVSTVKSRLRLARTELHRRAQSVEALKWIYEDSQDGKS